MPKIVIDVRLPSTALEQLAALPDVQLVQCEPTALQNPSRDLPLEQIRDAEVLVCTTPPRNHAEMTSLRFVQLSSVGYAQLYGLRLVERGVRACNARGVYDTAIAEWNLGMMIALGRDLRSMIRQQDQHRYEVAPRFAHEIRGSVVGLWGYGGIGRETARLTKTLGMRVHVYTHRPPRPRQATYAVPGTGDPDASLPDAWFKAGEELDFLAGLDFLILAMPLTPGNTGIIGERELRALKPTAFLLNPARGPLVQEAALVKALNEHWFAGAALDTHYYYPLPADHPLWSFPQVIITPHISGSDKGPHFLSRMGEIATHNIAAFLRGEPLWNELTVAELNGA